MSNPIVTTLSMMALPPAQLAIITAGGEESRPRHQKQTVCSEACGTAKRTCRTPGPARCRRDRAVMGGGLDVTRLLHGSAVANVHPCPAVATARWPAPRPLKAISARRQLL